MPTDLGSTLPRLGGAVAALLVALSACTSQGAPSVQNQPTVQAAATTVSAAAPPVAATVVAAASPVAATAAAVATPIAATIGAIATPIAATVGAIATPVAATITVAGTSIAATAGAIPTQVAIGLPPFIATAAAAATPAAGAAPPAVAPAAGASPVLISGIQLSPGDPTITIQNNGPSAVDLTGWRVRAGTGTATLPANTRIEPNGTLRLHTASGNSSASDVYLGSEGTALLGGLQPGARVELVNAQGNAVAELTIP